MIVSLSFKPGSYQVRAMGDTSIFKTGADPAIIFQGQPEFHCSNDSLMRRSGISAPVQLSFL